MNPIREFLSGIPDIDIITTVLDIALVFYLFYRMMLLIRGTRALQMLFGIFLVLALFVVSQEDYINLTTVNWILDKFVASFIVILIILFQPDIRRALSEFGKAKLFRGSSRRGVSSVLGEVVKAAARLSTKRIGALIVLERNADLSMYSEEAVQLDAKVTADMIFSIFIPSFENPLHDGAVMIRNGRISHAGCFLPLTDSPKVDKTLGTRHRAAIGLTEGTDAAVVVVSEESGTISLAVGGALKRGLDVNALREELMRLFEPGGETRVSEP